MATLVLLCDTSDEVSKLRDELRLADPGLIVEAASDPFQAVEAATRLRPEVVVTELPEHGLGDAELIRRLRTASPEARILVRTNVEDAGRAAEALAAGAQGYVSKARGTHEIVEAVLRPGTAVISPDLLLPIAQSLVLTSSQLRDLEAEVSRIREETTAKASAKSEFLANISHELRTPATVAKGIAYVLRNPSVADEERARFLEQLQVSLDELMAIIDEIITISEIERGKFSLDRAELDLSPLILHAVDDAATRYPDVRIDSDVAGRLPVLGDAPRLLEVVRELLGNACRYSPAGADVELRARSLDEGIVVSIADRGPGLPRPVAARAFDEPFSPGEQTLRKEKAGAGVGLHLARQLVVEHGGILWTDPLPGGGTRVAFCLPALGEQRVAAAPPAVTA
jgi:signal transduction histidine kinase